MTTALVAVLGSEHRIAGLAACIDAIVRQRGPAQAVAGYSSADCVLLRELVVWEGGAARVR